MTYLCRSLWRMYDVSVACCFAQGGAQSDPSRSEDCLPMCCNGLNMTAVSLVGRFKATRQDTKLTRARSHMIYNVAYDVLTL